MHFSKKKFVRIVSIILVLVMANPVTISASVNDSIAPRASDYLNSYNTYAYNAAWVKSKAILMLQACVTWMS